MVEGRVYYADKNGCYYLKLVGDVRVTLCASLKAYVGRIFDDQKISSVVVDLSEAVAVDSTTLGFLAKIALHTEQHGSIKPLMIITDPSLHQLIDGMGFNDIYEIVDQLPDSPAKLKEMPCVNVCEGEAIEDVIDAHKTLMSMNSKNMSAFSELVKALEREAGITSR